MWVYFLTGHNSGSFIGVLGGNYFILFYFLFSVCVVGVCWLFMLVLWVGKGWFGGQYGAFSGVFGCFYRDCDLCFGVIFYLLFGFVGEGAVCGCNSITHTGSDHELLRGNL